MNNKILTASSCSGKNNLVLFERIINLFGIESFDCRIRRKFEIELLLL